jgi:predicted nucleic acid-binding protein
VIVVDSSVWIAHLRNIDAAAVWRFRAIEDLDQILIRDIILLDVLQGARSESHTQCIEQSIRRFPIVSMLDTDLAIEAAANYRLLREWGVTVRKTIDLIIGTFCLRHGHALLPDDRDLTPMAEHLGLRLA